jgi:hypothetical protein
MTVEKRKRKKKKEKRQRTRPTPMERSRNPSRVAQDSGGVLDAVARGQFLNDGLTGHG